MTKHLFFLSRYFLNSFHIFHVFCIRFQKKKFPGVSISPQSRWLLSNRKGNQQQQNSNECKEFCCKMFGWPEKGCFFCTFKVDYLSEVWELKSMTGNFISQCRHWSVKWKYEMVFVGGLKKWVWECPEHYEDEIVDSIKN